MELTKEQTETKQEIEVKTVLITPEMAAEMLARNVKNRKINKNAVATYAESMRRGEWQLTPQGISFNQYNELADGQHRLLAVIEADISVLFMVFYNIDQDTFKVLDTGKNRSASDVLSIEGVKNSHIVASGVRRYFIFKNTQQQDVHRASKKVSHTTILEFYNKHTNLVDEIIKKSWLFYKKVAFYSLTDLVSIILYLHLEKGHNLTHIYGFFKQLVDGRYITHTPIEVLRTKLIQSALLSSMRFTPIEKLIMLKKVWNSYIKGEEIKRLTFEYDKKQGLDFI